MINRISKEQIRQYIIPKTPKNNILLLTTPDLLDIKLLELHQKIQKNTSIQIIERNKQTAKSIKQSLENNNFINYKIINDQFENININQLKPNIDLLYIDFYGNSNQNQIIKLQQIKNILNKNFKLIITLNNSTRGNTNIKEYKEIIKNNIKYNIIEILKNQYYTNEINPIHQFLKPIDIDSLNKHHQTIQTNFYQLSFLFYNIKTISYQDSITKILMTIFIISQEE